MTKEEVMALINKSIEEAKHEAKVSDSYFSGVQEGLKQAREIVEKLDKVKKVSK